MTVLNLPLYEIRPLEWTDRAIEFDGVREPYFVAEAIGYSYYVKRTEGQWYFGESDYREYGIECPCESEQHGKDVCQDRLRVRLEEVLQPTAAAIVDRCNGFAEVLAQLDHLTRFVENLPHQGVAEGPTAYMISESKKVLSKARGQA